MNKKQQYNEVFTEIFQIKEEELPGLLYRSIETWDSVGHMSLISAIEMKFDIMMDMDDIIDFNSYERGIEILSKYDIEF